MRNDRIDRIRESEKKSHTEIYTNEKLYSSDSWLSKPIKTVREISELFSEYDTIRVLDLGAGVGRNSIYLAEKYKNKGCLIDCVDLLEIAIEKLNQNAAEHSVSECINGINKTIEEYVIEPNSYDLIMAVSALEHVESKEAFIAKLEEIKQGIRLGGVILLVINSEIREISAETSEKLEPQFEVILQTMEMQKLLNDVFSGWEVIKETVVKQEYDIPRDGITCRLSTNVVTYVGRKDIKSSMLEIITFPEHEYTSVQKWLNKQGFCYTTRVYKEVGKYKVGKSYLAPWGDVLKVDDVQTFSKVSDRPFYDEMSEKEKDEIRKYSENMGLPYEFIRFSKCVNC